jgi:AraC-like DNA-binding protein
LWVHRISDGDGSYDQPILPDGCIDVVAIGGEVLLAGPASRSTTLRLAPGTLIVGARFRTGAGPAMVGASAAELRDRDIALDEVWGSAGARLATRLVEATSSKGRLDVMVDSLIGRAATARPVDPVGVGVASVMAARPGRPLTDLADDVGPSERQLRRRIDDAVGYSPRLLARVLRFQRFLRAARASGPGRRNLAWLAGDAGYADQAHLTRECRDLSGLPPAALLTRRLRGWPAWPLSGVSETFSTVRQSPLMMSARPTLRRERSLT